MTALMGVFGLVAFFIMGMIGLYLLACLVMLPIWMIEWFMLLNDFKKGQLPEKPTFWAVVGDRYSSGGGL